MKKKTLLVLLVLLSLVLSNTVYAASLSFSWLPNTESDIQGYKLYWGSEEGVYDNNVNIPYPPTDVDGRIHYTLENTTDEEGVTTYYVVTAYNENLESDFSIPIEYTTSSKPTAPSEFQLDIKVDVKVTTF